MSAGLSEMLRASREEVGALRDLITELQEDRRALAMVWKALGVSEYTGKHVADHVADLRTQVDSLRAKLEHLPRMFVAVEGMDDSGTGWFVGFEIDEDNGLHSRAESHIHARACVHALAAAMQRWIDELPDERVTFPPEVDLPRQDWGVDQIRTPERGTG